MDLFSKLRNDAGSRDIVITLIQQGLHLDHVCCISEGNGIFEEL